MWHSVVSKLHYPFIQIITMSRSILRDVNEKFQPGEVNPGNSF